MRKASIRILKIIIVLLLLAWLGIFLSKKIDLTTADLGRHITNGSVIINASWADKWAVLHTNFYSYTMPNEPFVNHHWLSGVVFYFLYQLFGFTGLSFFYVLLGMATLWLFWDVARRASNFFIATGLAIALMPLISSRAEVRPEMLTYFFTGVFFWIVWKTRKDADIYPSSRADKSANYGAGAEKRGSYKWLWTLPAVMLLWVNLHIGFVFGFLVLGAFGLEELIKDFLLRQGYGGQVKLKFKDRSRKFPGKFFNQLFGVGIVSVIVSLINPFGFKLLLYPLNIFKNYGYLIVENQSIKFLENLQFTTGQNFLLWKITAVVVILSFVAVRIKNWIPGRQIQYLNCHREDCGRRGDPLISREAIASDALAMTTHRKKNNFNSALLVLVLVTGAMSYLGIRNFPSFAFFALPALAANIYACKPKFLHPAYLTAVWVAGLSIVSICIFQQYQTFLQIKPILGFGLLPRVELSAEFLKQNSISGPIFNNYDVGGYLIYETRVTRGSGSSIADTHADQMIYVDNRPEAYTTEFFENLYKAPQDNPEKWAELDKQYNFNAIFFSYRDYTPWAQTFLTAKISDPLWAPVFVDAYNIIFLKRNQQNAELIKKFELPQSMFSTK